MLATALDKLTCRGNSRDQQVVPRGYSSYCIPRTSAASAASYCLRPRPPAVGLGLASAAQSAARQSEASPTSAPSCSSSPCSGAPSSCDTRRRDARKNHPNGVM